MARRYSVLLKDGTSIEFTRKDQAVAYYHAAESAIAVKDGGGATILPTGGAEVVSTIMAEQAPEQLAIVPEAKEGEAPVKEKKERRPRSEFYEVGESGGRFYRENYKPGEGSAYQQNPRSILRWTLGCSWAVLGELNLDNAKAASLALEMLEKDEITPDQLLAEGLPEAARVTLVTTPRVKPKKADSDPTPEAPEDSVLGGPTESAG